MPKGMSNLERSVYYNVQAALLDSECDPEIAVQVALVALIEFADTEVGMSDEALAAMVRRVAIDYDCK